MQASRIEGERGGQQKRLRIIDPETGAEMGLTGDIKAAQGRWLEARHSSQLLLIVDPATGERPSHLISITTVHTCQLLALELYISALQHHFASIAGH